MRERHWEKSAKPGYWARHSLPARRAKRTHLHGFFLSSDRDGVPSDVEGIFGRRFRDGAATDRGSVDHGVDGAGPAHREDAEQLQNRLGGRGAD